MIDFLDKNRCTCPGLCACCPYRATLHIEYIPRVSLRLPWAMCWLPFQGVHVPTGATISFQVMHAPGRTWQSVFDKEMNLMSGMSHFPHKSFWVTNSYHLPKVSICPVSLYLSMSICKYFLSQTTLGLFLEYDECLSRSMSLRYL